MKALSSEEHRASLKIAVSGGGFGIIPPCRAVLLGRVVRVTCLNHQPSARLRRRRATDFHDPDKITAYIGAAVALGRHCMADIAGAPAQSDLAGRRRKRTQVPVVTSHDSHPADLVPDW